VAEQDKQGDIGKSLADKDRRIKVANFHAEAVKGENDSRGEIAAANATLAEKEANAKKRSEIANQNAEVEIQTARAQARIKKLEADEIVVQEIGKRKIQIDAEAEAQRLILIAKGEATAILSIKEAEAEGIQKVLEAKAKGYQQLVQACGDDARGASTMLLIEKLEEIVRLQADAIKNIKIDKITVWDSGSGDHNKGSSTSNFLSSMVKAVPALHDIAKTAGLELPQYLGKIMSEDEGEKG